MAMGEQLLYRKRGIRLTNQQLEIRGGGVYPLSAIQGVAVREEQPNRRGPLLCMVIGLFPPAFPALIVGLIWLVRQKPGYWLSLTTEYGTIEPFGSNRSQPVRELQAILATTLEQRQLPLGKGRLDRLRTQLLDLAQQQGGEVSVTQGVMATGHSFEEVKQVLDEMLQSNYVQLDNHWETGVLIYRFPELLSRPAPTSDRPVTPPTPSAEQVRRQLLAAAQQQGGLLSVTQGVLATGQSFEVVQTVLESMAASGYVSLDRDWRAGVITYRFPELDTADDRFMDRSMDRSMDSPDLDPPAASSLQAKRQLQHWVKVLAQDVRELWRSVSGPS